MALCFIFPSSFLPLQMQLKQAIKLGSPPSLMCVKRMEDGGAVSEDDGLPCSPPEYAAARHAAAVRTLICSGKAGRPAGKVVGQEDSTFCLPFLCVSSHTGSEEQRREPGGSRKWWRPGEEKENSHKRWFTSWLIHPKHSHTLTEADLVWLVGDWDLN